MPTLTDIQKYTRDFQRYTGDGLPNEPVGHPLPVGDPASGGYNPSKAEIRQMLLAVLQAIGDPDALDGIISQIDDKADLQNTTVSFTDRDNAVSRGQENLPTNIGVIFTREGNYVALRAALASADDPLFATNPRWGVLLRLPASSLLDDKADASAIKTFALVNVGGTGNAATAEKPVSQADIGMSNGSLVTVVWPETNTTINPTLTIDDTEYAVRRQNGFDIQPEELAGGRSFLFFKHNAGTLRLVSASGIRDILGLVEALDDLTTGLDDKADQAELDARLPQTEATAGLVPVVVTETGQTAIWLTGGDIDGRGLARGLRQDAVKDIVSRRNQGVGTPLITAGEKVIAWLDAAGRFSAVGLRTEEGPLTQAQPRQQPLGADVPIATDGRTLHRLRRKIGLIRAGVAGQKLRIAMTGDSWSELVNIPNALIDLLSDRVAPAAGSFVQANTSYLWSGVSLTASAGWTRQDASVNSDWPYGTGPDGQNFYTTNDGETLSISGVEGGSLRIYTRAWGGAWEYSLNGGPPVSIAEADDSGALTVTEVSGLTAGANSLTITKTGGAGPVVFCGLLNVRSEAVEVAKVGNGGLTGYRLRDYASLVSDVWLDIDPDLVVVNLGTNDYRNGYSTVATYVDGLTQSLATIRAASPDAGVVIIAPPQSNGVAITPLSAYRDAAYTFAIENGCEFLNCLDSWGDYGGGLWTDSLHLNASGAAVIADQFNRHFIGA